MRVVAIFALALALVASAQADGVVRQGAKCLPTRAKCGYNTKCCDRSARCVRSRRRGGGRFCLKMRPFVLDKKMYIQMYEAGVKNPRVGPVLKTGMKVCPTKFKRGFSLFCKGTPSNTGAVRWYVNSGKHSRQENRAPWTIRGDLKGAARPWDRKSHYGIRKIRCRTNRNHWIGVIVMFTDSACGGTNPTSIPTTTRATVSPTRTTRTSPPRTTRTPPTRTTRTPPTRTTRTPPTRTTRRPPVTTTTRRPTTRTTRRPTTTTTTTAAPTCGRVRRSINDYSTTEWNQYVAAIGRMRTNGGWDNFVRTHATNEFQWHRGAYFLPAHRQMLWEFENLLRSRTGGNCPTCTIPYWDWSLTFDRWTLDPVWSRTGGCSGGTVPRPPFNTWRVQNPNSHIIRRTCVSGRPTNAVFERRSSLDLLVAGNRVEGTNYPDFALFLEIAHGSPHNGIGGDMMDGQFSPNDPMFYMHHANIDRIWQQWIGNFGNEFGGTHRCGRRAGPSETQQTCPASTATRMQPWGRTVAQIFSQLTPCVTYRSPRTAVRMAVADRMYMARDKRSVAEVAAEAKISRSSAYKGACSLIKNSKDRFTEAGRKQGWSEKQIKYALDIKKTLDTISYQVSEEDFNDPEAVTAKSDEEVAQDGFVAKARLSGGSAGGAHGVNGTAHGE